MSQFVPPKMFTLSLHQMQRMFFIQHYKCEGNLIHNGRDPTWYQVWKGPCNKDASNKEWEKEFKVPTRQQTHELHFDVDMQAMVANAF